MADGWVRSTATDVNNFTQWTAVQLVTLLPGQTLLRSWWNWGGWYLDNGINQYPPGASILRVGLLYAESGLTAVTTPTPISQADAEWLSITTLNPDSVQLSQTTTTGNAWMINWGFSEDSSAKSMRKNRGSTDMGLYICSEWAFEGAATDFGTHGYSASLDALVRTPEA